jgi:hypothetical protein
MELPKETVKTELRFPAWWLVVLFLGAMLFVGVEICLNWGKTYDQASIHPRRTLQNH